MTTSSSGSLLGTELFYKARCGVADLRTLALPVSQPISLIPKCFLTFRRLRIIKTDALDETAIAGAFGIGYHQIKKRPLLGAAACQSNHNHVTDPENAERARVYATFDDRRKNKQAF